MAGYRAAGWTCTGAMLLSLMAAIFGMRGIGIIGKYQPVESEKSRGTIELADLAGPDPVFLASENASLSEMVHSTDTSRQNISSQGGHHGFTLSQKLKVLEDVV